jgi:DNA relaxase NicK
VRYATNGSFTGEIGARTSQTFLRVYDKGVEEGSAPPGVVWRAELELKGARAVNTCHELLRKDDSASYSYSAVSSSLLARGGWWPPLGETIELAHGVAKPRPISDADRALEILRKQSGRLARTAHLKYTSREILLALGIDPQ